MRSATVTLAWEEIERNLHISYGNEVLRISCAQVLRGITVGKGLVAAIASLTTLDITSLCGQRAPEQVTVRTGY